MTTPCFCTKSQKTNKHNLVFGNFESLPTESIANIANVFLFSSAERNGRWKWNLLGNDNKPDKTTFIPKPAIYF